MTTIRPLASHDYDAWLALYHGYAEYYQTPLSEAGIATTWNWLNDNAHPLCGLVAEGEAGLIGLAHYRPMPSPLRGTNIGFLDDLFVAPDARGKGVAGALLDEVAKIAARENWQVVRWITRDDNTTARALYDQIATPSNWVTYEMKPS